MSIQLYYSNDIETLAENIASKLNKNIKNIYSSPIIIIPNPYLKKWLQMRIAEINGISINLDFQNLDNGLWKILSIISSPKNKNYKQQMITHQDLQVLILSVLFSSKVECDEMLPVYKYLYEKNGTKKRDYEKRIWQLTDRLSKYIIEYEHYREHLINSWHNNKLIYKTDMEVSQKFIYETIFRVNGHRDKLSNNLYTLPQFKDMALSNSKSIKSREIYIFGLSQLSPFHTKLIYDLRNTIEMYIYQLNPCSEFWEDITTPDEDRWKKIRSISVIEEDEAYILSENENDNSLLKQWGKPGRENLKLLSLIEEAGSMELTLMSNWLISEQDNTKGNVLSTVQNQILSRSQSSNSKKINQDTSLQVIACPDIFREVESVYSSIISNLERHSSLMMTDIAVMVSDIDLYSPVIKSVFSKKPNRISYSLIDSNAAIDSIFGRAIISVLDLASGKFTRKEVFELINNPCFLEAFNITKEDSAVWLRWTDELNIFHSYKSDSDKIDYSWEKGLIRLRMGRIMEMPDPKGENDLFHNYRELIPFADIDTGDYRQISSFCSAIEQIFIHVNKLQKNNITGSAWIKIIKDIISDLLKIPKDRPEELLVQENITDVLNRLIILKQNKLSLEFIREYITSNLSNLSSTHGSYLTSGVNVSGLIPKRQIPFEIVYILGMNGDMFPGRADHSALDLRNVKRMIGDISKPDANRYLFLETLISTQEKLYITYVSRDLVKDSEIFPNSVVNELISYIEENIIYDKYKTISIPMHSSSERYYDFNKDIFAWSDFFITANGHSYSIVNYSETDRLVSLLSLIDKGKIRLDNKLKNKISNIKKSHIPDFSYDLEEPSQLTVAKEIIDIYEINIFLKNPVESILRRHLQIYDLEEQDTSLKEDEPFFSDYPFNYWIMIDPMDYYLSNENHDNNEDYINKYYMNSQLLGLTPGKGFADYDLERYKEKISTRINGEEKKMGLIHILDNCKWQNFFRNISIGPSNYSLASDIKFSAITFDLNTNSKTVNVELSGSLPYIWKDNASGKCQALILTNNKDFKQEKVIHPFMFYITARSGLNAELHEFIGSESFIIHVSHNSGITSSSYHFTTDEAEEYLKNIVMDFLDNQSFDMIPFQVIVNDRELLKLVMDEKSPDDTARHNYRELLVQKILSDSEKQFPEYRPMRIMELINAKVPFHALDRAVKRLRPLLDSGNEEK